MTTPRLTVARHAAKSSAMRREKQGTGQRCRRERIAAAMLLGSALALSGCISVEAPDKPIVIELNINIKQEVIYRLAEDAGNTIDDNPDIF